jgi:hypothetical protein
MKQFKVTLWVSCYDGKAAIKAARDDIVAKCQGPRSQITGVCDAVQWLFDNSQPEIGLQVEESQCEEVYHD